MKNTRVTVGLPKFRITSTFRLRDTLVAMGMKSAFTAGVADFSGMAAKGNLFISEVVHKAFVNVDEKGTEAAAATAVIMEKGRPRKPDLVLILDRPFLFLIRDNVGGSVLFMGRVTDPRG
jgi:serpin B